jgi:hypothetical protein
MSQTTHIATLSTVFHAWNDDTVGDRGVSLHECNIAAAVFGCTRFKVAAARGRQDVERELTVSAISTAQTAPSKRHLSGKMFLPGAVRAIEAL